ncbi:MAG: DNA replication/repair protein RecF [Dehalococcoidia bacterium]|nr:DNA replication/repair protein RecF [Dehalococcoidia bacterium]
MRVTELSLTHFRNYRALELKEIPSGFVVLQGDNAQGKTNLLEALFLLATSRSPRAHREGELIAWETPQDGTAATRLFGCVRRKDGPVTIELLLMGRPEARPPTTAAVAVEDPELLPAQSGVRRRLRVNGAPRRALDLLGNLTVALFRPEDLDLITGPPSGRRRAIDILLSQVDPRYPRALQRYARAMAQRNHLLRRIADRRAGQDELAPWDDTLAREGAFILDSRRSALDRLAQLAGSAHRPLSGDREELSAAYAATVPLAGPALGDGGAAVAQAFLARLGEVRARDIALGQTTVGPHRDDLTLLVNGVPAGSYGSRGQQRTLALAWKLAEAEYLREVTAQDPVLLLDDVFSELDAHRRGCVMAVAGAYEQVFITTTGAELSGQMMPEGSRYVVRAGTVTPE